MAFARQRQRVTMLLMDLPRKLYILHKFGRYNRYYCYCLVDSLWIVCSSNDRILNLTLYLEMNTEMCFNDKMKVNVKRFVNCDTIIQDHSELLNIFEGSGQLFEPDDVSASKVRLHWSWEASNIAVPFTRPSATLHRVMENALSSRHYTRSPFVSEGRKEHFIMDYQKSSKRKS